MCINSLLFGVIEARITLQRTLSVHLTVVLMTCVFVIATAGADILRFIPIIWEIVAIDGSLPVSQAQY